MKPKILSWNVQGLNDPSKCLRVKNLIREWKADVICLQETKMKFIDKNIIRSLWNCFDAGWTTLDSEGASGGILVEEYVGEFLVVCSFSNVEDGFSWGFVGVYGPNVDKSRKLLWDEITGLCSWLRDSSMGVALADFSILIFELDLVDLPLARGDFTLSNGRAWSTLDKFIVSHS
ncbi:hypothetical protein I3760_07G102700 [Carya illinoinensis]|nr:hypothetical protein I3760_07G102700 [Carya illinoinensis]